MPFHEADEVNSFVFYSLPKSLNLMVHLNSSSPDINMLANKNRVCGISTSTGKSSMDLTLFFASWQLKHHRRPSCLLHHSAQLQVNLL